MTLRETYQVESREDHALTTVHDIDPRQLVEDRLTGASPDLLRELLTMFVDALMGAGADAFCGAGYGQRSDDRVNGLGGHRDFDTRVGTLDVAIPDLRSNSYFPDCLLQRRKRAEKALTTVVATCYLLGVPTRRMENLVDILGITSLGNLPGRSPWGSEVAGVDNGEGPRLPGRDVPRQPTGPGSVHVSMPPTP
ncbi:transposase [Rhodococcus ruber]|uniref:transposase n=1 Tax=Rhodococcus ruber TaxID=1830 RepID=UPI00387DC121